MRNAYKILVGKCERKKSRGISRLRLQNSFINIDFENIGYEDVVWIHLAQDSVQ
jgi:hypothetical protein